MQNSVVEHAISSARIGNEVARALGKGTEVQAGTPSLTNGNITGRHSNIFNMGWLGGIGNGSQFQGALSSMPIRPASSNNDLEQRIIASRGLKTGERLLTRWERPNNFNPGVGTDTWRDGQNVTWTLDHRGLQNVTSATMGPNVYPSGATTPTRNPLPLYNMRAQGLDANQTPPVSLFSTPSGYQAGMSLAEMQQTAQKRHTKARIPKR